MRQTRFASRLQIIAASIFCVPLADATAQGPALATSLKEAALRAIQGRPTTSEQTGAPNRNLVQRTPSLQTAAQQAPAQKASKSQSKNTGSVSRRFENGSTRYLHANRGFVRSGPGDQHYPTSVLFQSASVEVYLETDDGWSAVRPLASSHNWIPAQSAFLLPGGKSAEITLDEVPAWVGTELDQPKMLNWQSALVKGQVVQVLGEQTQKSQSGAEELWYKIAPPQGEFRWIRSNLLSTQMPMSRDASVQQASFSQSASNANSPVQVTAGQMVTEVEVPISEEINGSDGNGREVTIDGEIVWSDEADVLAEVNRQIRNEQGEIAQGLPPGATYDSEHFGGEFYNDMPSGEYIDGEYLGSVEEAMTPDELSRAKRHRSAQHQVDTLRHWDSLEASDPQLKMKPLASVLGLIGFGVVETERTPVSASPTSPHLPIQSQIAQERNAFPNGNMVYGQTLNNMNASTGNRLDRLPRPGRSAKVTSPQSGRDPLADISNRATAGHAGLGLGIAPGLVTNPIDPNKPVLTRLWNSDQPLFGQNIPGASSGNYLTAGQYPWYALNQAHPSQTHGAVSPTLAQSGYAGNAPQPEGFIPQVADWHADQHASTLTTSQRMNDAFADPLAEAEFQTPEIQIAMLDLTRIVSSPTENWNLNHLRDQCQRWIEQGGSSIVRGEARLLLERVERFDDLRTRTLGTLVDTSRLAMGSPVADGRPSGLPVQFASSTQSMIASAAPAGTGTEAISQASAHGVPGVADAASHSGDASGWLVQVHGSLPGQPEFALTDDQGKVVTYVQTTAALNIRRYLQQPVIIYGRRGYIPNLAARQITVERIARLR